jgi:hypothetical protein
MSWSEELGETDYIELLKILQNIPESEGTLCGKGGFGSIMSYTGTYKNYNYEDYVVKVFKKQSGALNEYRTLMLIQDGLNKYEDYHTDYVHVIVPYAAIYNALLLPRIFPIDTSQSKLQHLFYGFTNHRTDGQGQYIHAQDDITRELLLSDTYGFHDHDLVSMAAELATLFAILHYFIKITAADMEVVIGKTNFNTRPSLYIIDLNYSSTILDYNDYTISTLGTSICDVEFGRHLATRYDPFHKTMEDIYKMTAAQLGYSQIAKCVLNYCYKVAKKNLYEPRERAYVKQASDYYEYEYKK